MFEFFEMKGLRAKINVPDLRFQNPGLRVEANMNGCALRPLRPGLVFHSPSGTGSLDYALVLH